MDAARANGNGAEARFEKMDKDLKDFFDDQQKFISMAIGGLEERLSGRIAKGEGRLGKVEDRLGKVEERLERFERNVKIGFRVLDGRIGHLDRRLQQVDVRLNRMDRRMTREFAGIRKTLATLVRQGGRKIHRQRRAK